MLRRDDTQRMIYLLIVKGGNAASPIAPQPTRDGAVYEFETGGYLYRRRNGQDYTGRDRRHADERSRLRVGGGECETNRLYTDSGAILTPISQRTRKIFRISIRIISQIFQDFKDQAQEQYDLMVQAFNYICRSAKRNL